MTTRRCRPSCLSDSCASANGSRSSSSSSLGSRRRARRACRPQRQRTDALAHLKGIGEVGASRLALELFWREFSNRRQVGACVALMPQPWDSGESQTDQGISRQGELVDSFVSPIKIGDYLIESSVSVGVSLWS